LIECLQCLPDVTHAPAEKPALFVNSDKGGFYFRAGDIAVAVFVEDLEGGFCFGVSGVGRIEVGRDEVGPSTIFEAVIDRFSESLYEDKTVH